MNEERRTEDAFVQAAEDILDWEEKIIGQCVAKNGNPSVFFAHEKLERTVSVCLAFMNAVAKCDVETLLDERELVLRLKVRTLETNGKLAARTHLNAGLVNGITLIESTLFDMLLNPSAILFTLARLGVAFEPIVRGQLETNFTYLRYELELHNGKLPRFVRRQLFFFKRLPTLIVQLLSVLRSRRKLAKFIEGEGTTRQIEKLGDRLADAVISKSKGVFEAQRPHLRSIEAKTDIILWHTSGNDPRFAVKDGRSLDAVRELMVKEGVAMMLKNGSLNSTAVAESLVQKFARIPGAYEDSNSLRRQIDRAIKRPSSTL